jgi:hypothetical protein
MKTFVLVSNTGAAWEINAEEVERTDSSIILKNDGKVIGEFSRGVVVGWFDKHHSNIQNGQPQVALATTRPQ